MNKTTNKFSPEVHARAVRMVLDHESEHTSRWAAATSIAGKIGCSTHSLMEWVKKADVEAGRAPGVPFGNLRRLVAQRAQLIGPENLCDSAAAWYAKAANKGAGNAVCRCRQSVAADRL